MRSIGSCGFWGCIEDKTTCGSEEITMVVCSVQVPRGPNCAIHGIAFICGSIYTVS